MEMKEIQAIDTMNRVIYCYPESARRIFKSYEYSTMAKTTFGGVAKRLGIKPGEEWKIVQAHSSVKDMIAEMDEIGVEYVFMDHTIQWSYRDSTFIKFIEFEEMIKLIEESNGRIIGGAGYNPFRIKESLDEVEKAVKEYGFKYVWFHPTSFGLRPDERKCYPLYAKCIELDIPCCYQSGHVAEPLPSEPGHPMYADQVALDFPELKFVLTHTGWPWVDEWASMIWRHPNVYGNIGAYFPKALRPEQVRFMDGGAGREKTFWATNGLGLTRCKKEFLELPISDETKRKVLRENALKVFKLS